MNECCCKILSPSAVEEIEKTILDKKLVYIIAIDIDGNDVPLAPQEVKTHFLTQPIYTQKFIVNSLSFCCLTKCTETLSDIVFSELDALLNKKQMYILAFDNYGHYTVLKRYEDQAMDFSMDILSKSITFGVFSGSCCLFSRTADGQRGVPIVCYAPPPSYPCAPGFEYV